MSRWLLSPSKEKRNKDQLITGLEATSKNEAGRDEKQFVAISIFFFSFLLTLPYSCTTL